MNQTAVKMSLRMAWPLALMCAAWPMQDARAHGELLIQIAAVTRQIEAAAGNPASLYLRRGDLHREHRDWDEALADYARAASHDPKLLAVDFSRAQLLADRGEPESARVLLDDVLKRDPSLGEAFITRARVLVQLGHRAEAIADFRRGLQHVKEPQPEYFVELAEALDAEGRAEEALRQLDAGIQKFGPTVPLQGHAVELELRRENPDGAVRRLDEMMEGALRKESWLARRGDILARAGRLAEARQSYEVSLAAINILPPRLQQGPAMVELRSNVNATLKALSSAPPAPGTRDTSSPVPPR
jgi:tetratricopeptide (TPR) repeat protein